MSEFDEYCVYCCVVAYMSTKLGTNDSYDIRITCDITECRISSNTVEISVT